MNQVVILRRTLEEALRRLVRQPGRIARFEAGVNRAPRLTELLCRGVRLLIPVSLRHLPAPRAPIVFLWLQNRPGPSEEGWERLSTQWRPESSQSLAGPVALLALERAPAQGVITGGLLSSRGVHPLHSLKIVGPGMHRVFTQSGRTPYAEPPVSHHERDRWSRAIGALGEETWLRLRSLRYTLVGVGRTGSLIACSLGRLGVPHLTLIDPDRLEPHNLDAMDVVTAHEVGWHKVNALQGAVRTLSGPSSEVEPLPVSIANVRGLLAAKEADVLISCVDDDGARMAAGALATVYEKSLLDIGTGVFGREGTRRMGGDVRLILPGDRCLMCLGGVANPERARLTFMAQRVAADPPPSWSEERAGSLRSLNQIAAHLGMRLLEDLVGERLSMSTWIRVEFDPRGLPSLHIFTPAENPACPLCRLMGSGDEGIGAVSHLMVGREWANSRGVSE